MMNAADGPYDDDTTCPECKQDFDTSTESLKDLSKSKKLPFTCGKCFFFTLCGECLDNVDWGTFECPVCHKKQGFDRDDPVPNHRLCSVLRKQQGSTQAPPPSSPKPDVISPDSSKLAASNVTVDETPKKPSPSTPKRPTSPRRSTRVEKADETSPRRSTRVAKVKDEKPPAVQSEQARSKPKSKPTPKRKVASAGGGSGPVDHKKGERVYCRWPETNSFYWGHITKVNKRARGFATYKIKFDDGDIRDNVGYMEFLTEDEYDRNKKSPKDEEAPNKKKAKLSDSDTSNANDGKPISSGIEAAIRVLNDASPVPSELSSSDGDTKQSAKLSASEPVLANDAASASGSETSIESTAKDAFMTAPFFHVNSFMSAKNQTNKGFGPFIREQVATPGFHAVGQNVLDMAKAGEPHEAIRSAILARGGINGSEAGQVATWLREVKVGSYILLRHEYENCPWLPTRLKDDSGNYIGKVYVLGRVTQVVEPNSDEERAIAASLPEIDDEWCHTFCRVSFDKMLLKENLQPATTNYISKICQKTLSKICCEGGSWQKLGTNATRVRNDIWDNATIPISSQDFVESLGSLADTPLDSTHVQLDE